MNTNTRNFSKELEKIIRHRNGTRPRILLHSCCGPCSSSVLEYLTRFFEVSLLWYNPNLFPEEEFNRRLATQLELLEKMGLSEKVRVISCPWRSSEYYAAAKGLENEPEGGKRCTECFRLRLRECAVLAKEQGFDYFCTTLTVSRYKDALRINNLGMEIAAEVGIPWLPSDFKKNNGEMRSAQLAAQHDLYRQNYCGCEFSLQNRREYEARLAARQSEHDSAVDKMPSGTV